MTPDEMMEQPADWPEEDDDRCDLDPEKICDNCMKCVIGDTDMVAIQITGFELENEKDDPDQP